MIKCWPVIFHTKRLINGWRGSTWLSTSEFVHILTWLQGNSLDLNRQPFLVTLPTGYKELGRVNMKLQGGRRGAVLPSILRPSPSNSYFADVMNGGVGENDHLNDRNYCNWAAIEHYWRFEIDKEPERGVFVMRGGCVRTRGDEVARENITQKEKKKKRDYRRSQLLVVLSFIRSFPLQLFLFSHPSQLSSLFHFTPPAVDCSVQSRSRRERERERERGRKRDDGESEGGEVEERNERVVTGSVCVWSELVSSPPAAEGASPQKQGQVQASEYMCVCVCV